jgi:solute carrier family 25 folate transporter 32
MSSAMSPGGSNSTGTLTGSGSHSDSASSATPIHLDNKSPSRVSALVTRLEIYSTRIPSIYVTPFCGASAGVASGIVTCPLDVIKTKLQAQGGFQVRRNGKLVPSKAMYNGMVGTGRMIWKEEGVRGMYRGLSPMLLGYLPTWAVYLTVYDRSREYFYQKTGECRFQAS